MFTIGQLARESGLSRSTLLYYDSIGLLRPSGRTRANYRRYTAGDAGRLQSICLYRRIGLPLKTIGEILDSPRNAVRLALEKRLQELGKEVDSLHEQQQVIIRMLGDEALRENIPVMNRDNWVALLRSAGLDDEAMGKWHAAFEKFSPRLHQEFLEGLGLSAREIKLVRKMSQTKQPA